MPLNHTVYFLALGIVAAFNVLLYHNGASAYLLGWFSFFIAIYGVTSNDSIQILGTLVESKKHLPTVVKWGITGGVGTIVLWLGWFLYDGQIHYDRLSSFHNTGSRNVIHVLVPYILVILTRLKAPVSTTFLILGAFGGGDNISDIFMKSFTGYAISFVVALVVWFALFRLNQSDYKNADEKRDEGVSWDIYKWLSGLFLWGAWLVQDIANFSVYLPRVLAAGEMVLVTAALLAVTGILFYTNGGPIQSLISEKRDIQNVKAATIVDLVYAVILIFFQGMNNIPMSTTWVFLGLLAGREIILNILTYEDKPYLDTLTRVGRDVLYASLGVVISIAVVIIASGNG